MSNINTNHTKSTNSSLNGGSPSNKSLNSLTNTTNNSAMPSQQQQLILQQQQQQQQQQRHWSQKKHESVIASQCIEKTSFLSKIRGGSDSGQFIYFDASLCTQSSTTSNDSFDSSTTSPNNSSTSSSNSSPQLTNTNTTPTNNNSAIIPILSGKLYPNEIILEIQGKKVSGYTLYDVLSWLRQLATTYQSITLRTVKSARKHDLVLNGCANGGSSGGGGGGGCGGTRRLLMLPLDLRAYLDERFQKGSIDYDLQQIIRENVYMRTVPCTTRSPRPGEVHGQDYIFLTNEQFLEMEQHGDLLEYGVYNGHYYGTPKPPREPKLVNTNNGSSGHLNSQQSQSILNNKRNNSLNDINTANLKQQMQQQHKFQQQNQQSRPKSIEITTDSQQIEQQNGNSNRLSGPGVSAYQQQLKSNSTINNNNSSSTGVNEALHLSSSENNNENVELIPYGWEKVEDPEYGTFYIDHINKQTTYENPFLHQQQLHQTPQQQQSSTSSMKTFKPSSSSLTSTSNQAQTHQQQSSPSSTTPQQTNGGGGLKRNVYFTQNPNELKGDFMKTSLLKTAQGFGFTIIGANETSEDFLQIKYIVPEGAAARDGKLKQGDVLVYVNNECVLGYTHQDVVEIFQSIPIGQCVELTVCRGYPLSIDPNDPNIEIMPLAAINNPRSIVSPTPPVQAPLASVDELTASTTPYNTLDTQLAKPEQDPAQDEYYCEEYEELYASIVKGPKGFGFTIADDAQINHQKVKQILDKERCCNLQENDILLEINGVDLRTLGHMQVVDVLKECPKGQETIIKLKRRKYQIVLPSKPANMSLASLNNNIQQSLVINTENTNGVDQTTTFKVNGNHDDLGNTNGAGSSSSTNDFRAQTQFNLKSNQQQQFLNSTSTNHLTNPNQVAFNYERRSKTPNILQQSNSQVNFLQQQQQQPVTPNGTYANQPQLRSKTPTTDRLLFQHSLNNGNNNEYIYLNSNNNTNGISSAINKKSTPTINTNNNNITNGSKLVNNDALYSTVNKSKLQQKLDDELLNELSPNQQHMPIYDSTTNIQHQRVIQNLNKFNQQMVNTANNSNSINQQLIANRSKTPGPDVIYFRNNNNNNDFNQYIHNGYTNGTKNISTNSMMSNGTINRSKTPTADMMYYPSMSNNILIKRGGQPTSIADQQQQQILFNDEYPLENHQIISDVDGNNYIEMIVDLYKQETGFGFRIVGGEEEGSQVAIGFIVQGGAAHLDGRLRPNDEIIMIDNECVLGATHRRVVQLMAIAGLNGKVKLMIRRRITASMAASLLQQQQHQRLMSSMRPASRQQLQTPQPPPSGLSQTYPYTITLFRNGNEGFGFVIISTINKIGPSIGKIVENSPAERCKRLNIGDRILAVNGINITQMNHIEIVKLIKESGNSITLTIGSPSMDENMPTYLSPNETNGLKSQVDYGGAKLTNGNGRQYVISPTPLQQQLPPPQQPAAPALTTKAIINQNEYHVIELRKHQSGGFGFSIRGGKEFNIPLFVLKLADQGPAALDGRLEVGDQILEINGCDAYSMTHTEAIERIKSGGNIVTLLIRRTGMPPPSITDIIAANATAAVANAQQQQQQQQQQLVSQMVPSVSSTNLNNDLIHQQTLRSKSPYLSQQQHQQQYHQQQFKHFNSSGTLINRNF